MQRLEASLELKQMWKKLLSTTVPASTRLRELGGRNGGEGGNSRNSNGNSNHIGMEAREECSIESVLDNSSTVMTLLSSLCASEAIKTGSSLDALNESSLFSKLLDRLNLVERFTSDEFLALKEENLELRKRIQNKSLLLEQQQRRVDEADVLEARLAEALDALGAIKR